MKNKGVKSVFKRGKDGKVFGSFPLWPISDSRLVKISNYDDWVYHFIREQFRDLLLESYRSDAVSSFRLVVDDLVIEAHVDKHKNLIYREYEKKK